MSVTKSHSCGVPPLGPFLDAAALAAAIASGQISAVQALQECQARIMLTDGRINAFTSTSFPRARAEAAAVDAALAKGQPLGPLAGVPYAVKNLFDVQGEVTLAGSKVLCNQAAAVHDAVLVQRMRAAGAVLMGSLNMDEFAYGFTTENSHYGPTCNPHDIRRIAGGSSGGSAAAVAAGQAPLTLGTDTNGSIRVPASLCGVWGVKPTFGRLSRRGAFPFVHSIDHMGAMAGSATSLALVYDALQGPDLLDPGCHALSVQPVLPSLNGGVGGLRVGVLGGYFDTHASSSARTAAASAGNALGASDIVTWPDAALARAAAFIITASEGGSLHIDRLRAQADDMEPLSVDRFIAGALQPADWTLRAQRFRRIYRDKINKLFTQWDLLVAPATPVSAPIIGAEWIDINSTQHPSRAAMGLLTQPISFAGCPVVVAPLWPNGDAGMPLGVQLIAAPWREDLAFRAAQALQAAGVARVRAS